MPPAKRMWQRFSLNFSICQALLHNPRIGIRGPTGQTCRASLAYSALAECCRPMQKYRDRQKAPSLFTAEPSTNLSGLKAKLNGWQASTTARRTAAASSWVLKTTLLARTRQSRRRSSARSSWHSTDPFHCKGVAGQTKIITLKLLTKAQPFV